MCKGLAILVGERHYFPPVMVRRARTENLNCNLLELVIFKRLQTNAGIRLKDPTGLLDRWGRSHFQKCLTRLGGDVPHMHHKSKHDIK